MHPYLCVYVCVCKKENDFYLIVTAKKGKISKDSFEIQLMKL